MKKIGIFLVFAILWLGRVGSAASMGGPGTYLGDGHDVLMQGFTNDSFQTRNYWDYLTRQVGAIAASGATMLWLPPSADSVGGGMGYLPKDWYNQNSAYGSQADLRRLIATLKFVRIKVIADIVVDHRCGDRSVFDYENPRWTNICDVITLETNQCGTGTPGTGDSPTFAGAPGLNHRSTRVQIDIIRYLRWMETTMGYSGFRWDYVKGFAPTFVKEYLDASRPYFSVGEYWDGDTGRLEHWVGGTGGSSAVFDYPLKYVLNRVLSSEDYTELSRGGRLNGMIGKDPEHAVTFLENHDTQGSGSDGLPRGKELEGYAFLLTHPGTPTLFYGHYFATVPVALPLGAEQKAIADLVRLRKRNGINARSSVQIWRAQRGLYAALIDQRVALRLGPTTWSPPGQGWRLSLQGENYAVWERAQAQP